MLYNKVGFRVKLNIDKEDVSINDIKCVFGKYFDNFDVLELKLNKDLLDSTYLENIVDVSNMYLNKELSLHLPSNMLEDSLDTSDVKSILNKLNKLNFNKNTRLITHFPEKFNLNHLQDRVKYIEKRLPDNAILLIENINKHDYEVYEYIDKINSFFEMFNKYNKIYFCLDLGHLLFSSLNQGIDNYHSLNYLKQYKNLIRKIRELHLHDFNYNIDHLCLGKGFIELDNIYNFIIENNIKCPIILEVTLNDLFIDGFNQIRKLNTI